MDTQKNTMSTGMNFLLLRYKLIVLFSSSGKTTTTFFLLLLLSSVTFSFFGISKKKIFNPSSLFLHGILFPLEIIFPTSSQARKVIETIDLNMMMEWIKNAKKNKTNFKFIFTNIFFNYYYFLYLVIIILKYFFIFFWNLFFFWLLKYSFLFAPKTDWRFI